MSLTVMALSWALVGAALSLALRPTVVRCLSKASPETTPPPLGVLEGLTATLFVILACRFETQLDLLIFSVVAVTGVPLAALDVVARTLPNVLVGATYIGVLPLLGLDAILNGPGPLVRALLGGAVVSTAHGALYAAGAIGGGDLKLVGVLASTLGWISWTATWTGLVVSWLIASAAVVVGKVLRRESRHAEVPLGMFLIIGTLVTALALTTK